METDVKIKREVYPDILRILAISFVVMIHCMIGIITTAALYGTRTWYAAIIINPLLRTGVPVFFMLSGYLTLNNPKTLSFGSFYKKKLTRVLIPFIIWDVIYFLVNSLTDAEAGIQPLRFFTELFDSGSNYHLWYVYTIAALYLLAPFLKIIVDKCSARQLVLFLVLVTFCSTIRPFINTVTPVYIYMFDPLSNGYMGFFILGYLLGKYPIKPVGRIIIYACGVAGYLYSIFTNIAASSPAGIDLAANGGFAINQFAVSAALFLLVKNLPQIKKDKVCTALEKISQTAYGVYLSHILVMRVTYYFTYMLSPWKNVAVCFIVSLAVPVAVMIIASRVKTYILTHLDYDSIPAWLKKRQKPRTE